MRMASHLFIVARDHARLYDDLVERFRDDRKVRVILDRRQGERRLSEGAITGSERRSEDRRSRGEIDEQLRARSHVVVTLPESSPNSPSPDRSG
jgi:hypothetical protein